MSLPPLPAELVAYFNDGYKPGSDDDNTCFISISEMQSYAKLAVREALERAAHNWDGSRLVDGQGVADRIRALAKEYADE